MKKAFLKRLLLLIAGRTMYVWNGPRGALIALALVISGAPASVVAQTIVLLILSALAYVGEAQDRLMRVVGIGHATVHALLWVAGAGLVVSAANGLFGRPGMCANLTPNLADVVVIFARLIAYLALIGYMFSTIIFFLILTIRAIANAKQRQPI